MKSRDIRIGFLEAQQAVIQAATLARQALRPNLAADLEEINRLLDRDSPVQNAPDESNADTGQPVRIGDVWRHRLLGERGACERLCSGWRMTQDPNGSPAYMFDDYQKRGDWIFVRRGQPGVSPALQGPVDDEFEAHISKEMKGKK